MKRGKVVFGIALLLLLGILLAYSVDRPSNPAQASAVLTPPAKPSLRPAVAPGARRQSSAREMRQRISGQQQAEHASLEVSSAGLAPAEPLREAGIEALPRIIADVVHEGKIKARETFYDLLKQQGVPSQQAYELIKAAKSAYNLNRLSRGRLYRMYLDRDGTFRGFEYFLNDDKVLVVKVAGENIEAELQPTHYVTKLVTLQGIITSSLFKAVVKLGESADLALRLADIFAWEIDFSTDLRRGDHFHLVVEKLYRGDEFVKYGDIHIAEVINVDERYHAILFSGSKTPRGYYTPEGGSLRKTFLKSPLRFTRITSRFTSRRFHPILKRYRPHHGVDYAAPHGTPVVTVGDGVVELARRKGPNGNMVRVRHSSVYTTYYLHLSRFGSGIKRGARVVQGQVIGYVGSTGLSTGPHLDFRITKRGSFINPLTLRPPRALPVAASDRASFTRLAEARLKLLEDSSQLVAGSVITNSTVDVN